MQIGDPWPFRSSRGLTGGGLQREVWHGLVVPPQKERRARDRLENAGVEVEYPTYKRIRHVNGRKTEFTIPAISQIIYAKFDRAPQWDVMKERGIITGVFSNGVHPVEIKYDVVCRVMGLPLESERLELERIKALTPVLGESVHLNHELLGGLFVDVEKTALGRVWWRYVTRSGVIRGEAGIEDIRRVAR